MIFRFDDDNGMYYEFEFPNTRRIHIVVHNPPLIPHYLIKDYSDDKVIDWVRNDGIYYVSLNAKKYITKVLKNLAFT